jgi:serine protease Do
MLLMILQVIRAYQPESRHSAIRILVAFAIAANFMAWGRSVCAAPATENSVKHETIVVIGIVSAAQRTDSIGLGRESHSVLLVNELKAQGYPAVDAKSASRDSGSTMPGLFALGGTLSEVYCESDKALQCSIAIRWELKDLRTRQTVYRVTTRARATGSDGNELGPRLLKAALQSLLGRAKFSTLLQSGQNDNLPASSLGAISNFRECPQTRLSMPESSQFILSATVLIESGDGLGSGSVISPDGFILTAAHVVEPGAPLHVQLSSGPVMEAILIRRDSQHDVALLQVKGTSFKQCLPLRQEPINVGEEVYAIGSPLSKELSFSLTRGIVSGFRMIEGVPLVQTDASVNPGNSGGPLIDKKGRLIAIVDFKISSQVVQGLAFAVTAQAALEGLHLHSAESSDAALSTPLLSEPSRPKNESVDDVDDVSQPGDAPEEVTHGTSSTPSTLRAIGGITASLGLVGVGTSWLMYEVGKGNMKRSEFNTYLTVNNLSWVAVGLGAGTFTLSYLIGDGRGSKRKHEKKHAARIYGGIGLGSVVVGGEL